MEEFKDVMLSEPPPRFAAAPTSSALHATSLENYKGILLCDRPNDVRAKQGPSAPAFLPSGKAEDVHVGLQPSLETRSRFELSKSMRGTSKALKPSALTRHRHWLKEFGSDVRQTQLARIEEQLVGDEKEQEFREKQSVARKQAAELKKKKKGSGEESSALVETSQDMDNTAPSSKPDEDSTLVSTGPKPPKASKPKAKGGKKKPKWAMTEEEAEGATKEEDSELADLVQFAEGLNFHHFIEDYEVKEALAIMRERVEEIAAEQGVNLEDCMKREPESGSDVEEASTIAPSEVTEGGTHRPRRRVKKASKEAQMETASAEDINPTWNKSTRTSTRFRSAVSGEALALAEKVLASSESMRHIHSKQSLAMLLQEVSMDPQVETFLNKSKKVKLNESVAKESTIAPPIVTTLAAESVPLGQPIQKRVLTELRKSKEHVQNLPYLYRCPSI